MYIETKNAVIVVIVYITILLHRIYYIHNTISEQCEDDTLIVCMPQHYIKYYSGIQLSTVKQL